MGVQRNAPAALSPGKNRYPSYRRLGGRQNRSEQVRKISTPPGFDPRTVQPVASRYTDWSIPAPKDTDIHFVKTIVRNTAVIQPYLCARIAAQDMGFLIMPAGSITGDNNLKVQLTVKCQINCPITLCCLIAYSDKICVETLQRNIVWNAWEVDTQNDYNVSAIYEI